MKIRKGDILYQCNSNDISDKDYCSYELLKRLSDRGLDCSSDDFDHEACPSFSRCWERPQKATMTKLRVTDIRIALWYCVDVKYNTRHKLSIGNVNDYSKSERGAYRKLLNRLNKLIYNVEKGTPGYFHKRKRRNLKSYISLRDRIKEKINEHK